VEEDLSRQPGHPTIESKTFSQTFWVKEEEVRQEARIEIAQEPFYLTEADFIRLKNGRPKIFDWANALLLASLGFALSLLAKFIVGLVSTESPQWHIWEFVALSIGFLLAVILYVLGRLLPNEGKRVMGDIEKHFRTAPRSKQPLREKK